MPCSIPNFMSRLRQRITQHMKYSASFDGMLRHVKKGTPVLFLVARVGKGKSSNSAIDELEIEFINYAFSRNKSLHNDRGIKKPKYVIDGFGGRVKPAKDVTELKKMIGYYRILRGDRRASFYQITHVGLRQFVPPAVE